MVWVVGLAVVAFIWWLLARSKRPAVPADVSMLPERFVVFDLETTGLRSELHEIIEIGPIRVNRDAEDLQAFQTLVKPKNRVPKKITKITGITNEMVQSDGLELVEAPAELSSALLPHSAAVLRNPLFMMRPDNRHRLGGRVDADRYG
jgi:DNA polymerase III subunit epsilon